MSDDRPSDAKPTPRAKDVLGSISIDTASASKASTDEKQYSERIRTLAIEQQTAFEHLIGIRDHYRQKNRWSRFLMGAIAGMLIFQCILLALVGSGIWDFTAYDWLLPALLVQNLAQVVGLAVWAVKYLFSDITQQRLPFQKN